MEKKSSQKKQRGTGRYMPIGKAACTKEQIIEALIINKGLVYRALKATGLSSATFYTWKKDDPVFAADVDATEQIEKDWARCKLAELVDEGNPQAVIFYNRCKNGFVETKKVEATVNTPDTIDVSLALDQIKNTLKD